MTELQSKAQHLGFEEAIHGQPWGQMHGGYFSNAEVARPLVEAVWQMAEKLRPEVIVDLGGGTGFLLSQVQAGGVRKEIGLVNLDCSPAQLAMSQTTGVSSVHGSVTGFRRDSVVRGHDKALWLMRSVLHYAGEAGLSPLLRHLRLQAKPGECWIHQTACFDREEEADCLNELYRRMHTGKWYPTREDLQHRLEQEGWQVISVLPAPVLHLDSAELSRRYGLSDSETRQIGEEMANELGPMCEVYRMTANGFQADLRYSIWLCEASA